MNANRWIAQYLHQIPTAGLVLDVASGNGRHAELALQQGYRVIAVDRDISAINHRPADLECLQFNLEAGNWPFPPAFFDGIIVCNYLHRPLMSHIVDALRPDGVLLYTTFMQGNEAYGSPRNPAYLLRPGELQQVLTAGFEPIAFEQGFLDEPAPAMRQSICVRKQADRSIVKA